MEDVEKHINDPQLKSYTPTMKEAGFDVKVSPMTSITCSGQVGGTIRELASMRPLFLDCFTAIQLSYLMSYYNVFGNAAVQKLLQFHGLDHLSTSYDSLIIACRPVSEGGVIHVGQVIYIQGPRFAFAFKSSSTLNGFNATCVADRKGRQRFRAFSSFGNVDRKLEGFCDIMLEAYQKPLTYRDVVEIFSHYTKSLNARCRMLLM